MPLKMQDISESDTGACDTTTPFLIDLVLIGRWNCFSDQPSADLQPNLDWCQCTEIGEKAWLFAKLQSGRARKRINAT